MTEWRDAMPCYLSVQDRNLRIQEINALFRRDFGERLGDLCYEVYKRRGSPCVNCPVLLTFEDGESHSDTETVITEGGDMARVMVHSAPFRRDSQGKIIAVVEMSVNITEMERLQRELALIGRAVAGVAHRIKNLVMGIEGGIYVVNTGMEEKDDEGIAKGWSMVQRNASKVSQIAKALLYCSKKREPKFADDVSPAAIIGEVHELFRKRLAKEKINLILQLDCPPYRGRYDPEGLHSVLTNLVANAVDACRFDTTEGKDHHTICLRCRRDGAGNTVLEVSDDGIGVPEEVKDRVFEDFFSTKGNEGTGLGLLVARKIVEEHGGNITFTSEPRRGTTFGVVLPPGGAVKEG